jgi:serine/threonine protein kinase
MIEMAGMPEFISYKHLSVATKQFSDQSKLGEGGFGSVYRGILPKTGAEVAVKKVSNDSRQGEREFLAEVKIISNVVELMGFCRDRGKFLLVYELLPRGSLDQALFKPKNPDEVLSWSQRWKIVSGTAAALHYLHEGWRQQVIHRDVKSSNIMLDEEYNPKLGDFGLARLVDHEKHAATTMVAGTYGYIAPEAAGGKFTDKTDVFAFGVVALELACGRKAYKPNVENYEDLVLVDMVWRRLKDDQLLSVADPLLNADFDYEQMCVVLKLGLLCSHPDPASRPTMRQVVQVLAGDAEVPVVPESQPNASAFLRQNIPLLSIDDLLSSRSGTQNSGDKEIVPVLHPR